MGRAPSTIVLMKGLSQYGVLRHLIDDIAAAFTDLGYDSVIVDPTLDSDWASKLEIEDLFFVFAFNGICMDDCKHLPFHAFMVDHPIYHHRRLMQESQPQSVISFVSKEHVQFFKRATGNRSLCTFLPHAATPRGPGKPMSERSIEVLFAGSYRDPDEIRRTWARMDDVLRKLADDIIDMAVTRPLDSIVDVAVERMKEHDVFVGDGMIDHVQFSDFVASIDLYLRYYWRRRIVTSMSDAPLSIYGSGWETLQHHLSRHVTFHPQTDFLRVRELMAQTKVVVTVNPNFSHGGHERIFESMMSESVTFATENHYLRQEFTDGEDILLYRPDMPDLGARLMTVLLDEDRLQVVASQGRQTAMEHHTWKHRARQIADNMRAVQTLASLQI